MSTAATSPGTLSFNARMLRYFNERHSYDPPTLPQEVLNLIVEEFAVPYNLNPEKASTETARLRPILCKLRFVSRSFNEAASRLLYKRMISIYGPRHSAFLRTIIKNPRLARYVRVYHTPTTDIRTGHVYSRIKACLPLMSGLTELVYRRIQIPRNSIRTKPLPRHLPNLKTRRRPFQLKQFVWFSETTRPDEDIEALQFLTSQKNLHYLGWSTTAPLPAIHKDTIPQDLRCLDAAVPTILEILPNRPSIEAVRWRAHGRSVHYSSVQIQQMARQLCRMEDFHRLSFISLTGSFEEKALEYLYQNNAAPFPRLTSLALQTIGRARGINFRRLFPQMEQLYFPSPSAMQHHMSNVTQVDELFLSNLHLQSIDMRANIRAPLAWHRFEGWTRVSMKRTMWFMSPDYKFIRLLYDPEDNSIDDVTEPSPF